MYAVEQRYPELICKNVTPHRYIATRNCRNAVHSFTLFTKLLE